MRCFKCNQHVPESYKICPFCNQDLTEIPVVEEKTIEVKEKSKNPIILIIVFLISFIMLLALIGYFGLVNLFKITNPELPFIEVFKKIDLQLEEYLYDKYVGNFIFSNEYKEKNNSISGSYEVDIKNRIVNIFDVYDSTKVESDVNKTSIYLNKDKLYVQTDYISNNVIEYDISDYYGLLSTEKYDGIALVNGIFYGLINGIKKVDITSNKNVEIKHINKTIKVNSSTLRLNNKNKKIITEKLFDYLIDDINFVTELSKSNKTTTNETIELLNKLKDKYSNKFSVESNYYTDIIIYYKNKDIYGIDIKFNEEDIKSNINILIGNNIYNIIYTDNDKKILDIEIKTNEENIENSIKKTYELSGIYNDEKITTKLVINESNSKKVFAKSFDNTINYTDIINNYIKKKVELN